mgnify:CR=1 FL=1
MLLLSPTNLLRFAKTTARGGAKLKTRDTRLIPAMRLIAEILPRKLLREFTIPPAGDRIISTAVSAVAPATPQFALRLTSAEFSRARCCRSSCCRASPAARAGCAEESETTGSLGWRVCNGSHNGWGIYKSAASRHMTCERQHFRQRGRAAIGGFAGVLDRRHGAAPICHHRLPGLPAEGAACCYRQPPCGSRAGSRA